MEILTFKEAYRSGETTASHSSKTERRYIDFIISGKSLGDLLEVTKKDLTGTFGWTENSLLENEQINEYIGLVKAELQTGRTSLYVCPECGDIGCGAITVKIEMTDDTVTWKDFGYENDVDAVSLDEYNSIGPFTFNKKEYIKTFETIRREIK